MNTIPPAAIFGHLASSSTKC